MGIGHFTTYTLAPKYSRPRNAQNRLTIYVVTFIYSLSTTVIYSRYFVLALSHPQLSSLRHLRPNTATFPTPCHLCPTAPLALSILSKWQVRKMRSWAKALRTPSGSQGKQAKDSMPRRELEIVCLLPIVQSHLFSLES